MTRWAGPSTTTGGWPPSWGSRSGAPHAATANFILQNYVDPPTEIVKPGEVQIWKITHNGVDTHPIHFHLFDVQMLNRVAWDGIIRPTDPNELGWKDTVRMQPVAGHYRRVEVDPSQGALRVSPTAFDP